LYRWPRSFGPYPQLLIIGEDLTSSVKSRNPILRAPNRPPSRPWLHLEILSLNIMNRTDDKEQPWQSPTLTGMLSVGHSQKSLLFLSVEIAKHFWSLSWIKGEICCIYSNLYHGSCTEVSLGGEVTWDGSLMLNLRWTQLDAVGSSVDLWSVGATWTSHRKWLTCVVVTICWCEMQDLVEGNGKGCDSHSVWP